MVEERLLAYMKHHPEDLLPKHILFYRDGVSESQYGMVRRYELSQVQEACRILSQKYQLEPPNITMLVVGKRHHTRFYPASTSADADKNLKPGLIVDHTVVTPEYQNFYLQSHDAELGRARSGHYVVIENETGYSPEKLQELVSATTKGGKIVQY